jgi:hypothetical protein
MAIASTVASFSTSVVDVIGSRSSGVGLRIHTVDSFPQAGDPERGPVKMTRIRRGRLACEWVSWRRGCELDLLDGPVAATGGVGSAI